MITLVIKLCGKSTRKCSVEILSDYEQDARLQYWYSRGLSVETVLFLSYCKSNVWFEHQQDNRKSCKSGYFLGTKHSEQEMSFYVPSGS